MARPSKGGVVGPVVALAGALVYLYVVYTAVFPGFAGANWAGSAAFWLPIFSGLAAAAAFSLLLVSLGAVMGMVNDMATDWAMKANFMTGVSLFALTAGGVMFWYVAVGLLLAQFGVAKMKMG